MPTSITCHAAFSMAVCATLFLRFNPDRGPRSMHMCLQSGFVTMMTTMPLCFCIFSSTIPGYATFFYFLPLSMFHARVFAICVCDDDDDDAGALPEKAGMASAACR